MIKTKRCAPDRGTDKKRGLKSPRGFAAAHLVKAIYFLEDLQPLGHGCPNAADFSPLSRTAQSADLSLPIITQDFSPRVFYKATTLYNKKEGSRPLFPVSQRSAVRDSSLSAFLPQSFHLFQSLTLGLRNHLPNKEGRQNRHKTVKAVSHPSAELHHSRIGRRYKIVGGPLRSYSYSHGTTANLVGENLRNQYPANGPPRHHKRSRIHDNKNQGGDTNNVEKGQRRNGKHSYSHSNRTHNQ